MLLTHTSRLSSAARPVLRPTPRAPAAASSPQSPHSRLCRSSTRTPCASGSASLRLRRYTGTAALTGSGPSGSWRSVSPAGTMWRGARQLRPGRPRRRAGSPWRASRSAPSSRAAQSSARTFSLRTTVSHKSAAHFRNCSGGFARTECGRRGRKRHAERIVHAASLCSRDEGYEIRQAEGCQALGAQPNRASLLVHNVQDEHRHTSSIMHTHRPFKKAFQT